MLSFEGERFVERKREPVEEMVRLPEESREKEALGEDVGGRVEVEKGEKEKMSK